MISIEVTKDCVIVEGHANQTIACEAVTAITQSVINYAENNLRQAPIHQIMSGYFEFWTNTLYGDDGKLLSDFLITSLNMIAQGYPEDMTFKDLR